MCQYMGNFTFRCEDVCTDGVITIDDQATVPWRRTGPDRSRGPWAGSKGNIWMWVKEYTLW